MTNIIAESIYMLLVITPIIVFGVLFIFIMYEQDKYSSLRMIKMYVNHLNTMTKIRDELLTYSTYSKEEAKEFWNELCEIRCDIRRKKILFKRKYKKV
jgi:hypothetical protein